MAAKSLDRIDVQSRLLVGCHMLFLPHGLIDLLEAVGDLVVHLDISYVAYGCVSGLELAPGCDQDGHDQE